MCRCIGIGMSSISIMGTVRVSSVKFCSICLRALSASPAGGFPATATPLAAAAAASGRGRRLFHAKLVGRTGPTSAMQHKGHPSETLSPKKHDIYLKYIKKLHIQTKKQYRRRLTYLSSHLAWRHWHLWIPGEVDPDVWVVLNHGDLLRYPCKEIIIEGLYGPSATLSQQQRCPSAHRRESS
jgi:hypothetical protein